MNFHSEILSTLKNYLEEKGFLIRDVLSYYCRSPKTGLVVRDYTYLSQMECIGVKYDREISPKVYFSVNEEDLFNCFKKKVYPSQEDCEKGEILECIDFKDELSPEEKERINKKKELHKKMDEASLIIENCKKELEVL